MKKRILSAVILAGIMAVSSCSEKREAETTVTLSKEDQDAAYSKLTEEQRRLPENAVAGLQAAEGLQVQLFASEPMIGNPTNIDVDARGRVWMCEAYNYRPQLNPDNPQREQGDRILILEDVNGDGQADSTKVFYQGTDVNAALGIAVLGNKVIVSSSPNVFLFTDTDGDDVADKKEIIFSGLEGVQHDHAIHSFTFGPDGKLYFNFGNEGKKILDRNGKPIIDKDGKEVNNSGKPYRQGMVFRVNPDGTELEVLAHNFRNNYEAAVDSYGTLWQSDNDDDGNQGVRINYVMEFGNYGYTDEMTGAGWQASRTNMEEDIPSRHWHQNDPGSIPNLLQTGAGSPTGMVVYEGDLLPEVYHNQMIHADAGPSIVRSYPVKKNGAGYTAEIVPVVEGTRDQWFRPSDVTVAPDGSLFIADWYDPGVGGHQMGDMNRGRIYRVAPAKASSYKIPVLDLSTPRGAMEALQSPNLATRYLAWENLNGLGAKAEPVLQEMWKSDNPRYRARALWLLAKIDGKGEQYIQQALKDQNPDIRITGLRVARQESSNIIPYVKQLVKDKNPQVRREAAIALRHNKSSEAPALWAELAQQYDGKDRWYLEALGIGADEQWDSFFAAWKEKAGDNISSDAGRDIIWRSRTGQALPLLANNITSEATSSEDRQKYFRAFDFIQGPAKEKVLLALLDEKGQHQEEISRIALNHISPASLAKNAKVKVALDKTLANLKGKKEYLDLVNRYQLRNHNNELLQLAIAYPDSSLGAESARLLMSLGGTNLLKKAINSKNEEEASAALQALGRVGNKESMALLESVMMDNSGDMEVRKSAVVALGGGWTGGERLMQVMQAGKVPEELKPTAAATMAGNMRRDVQIEGLKYFEAGSSAEGKKLPSISELVKLKGDAVAGEKVFVSRCSTCHQDGKQGANFGPALAHIGDKLPKQGLYMAIIEPDAGISFGYEGYQIKMKDGSEMVGIIVSETEDEIELKNPGGSSLKLDKAKVASRTQMEGSLMPALQMTMTQQELVDLTEYLSTLKEKKDPKLATK
jgi:putative membrane-bound dehydrogenase-like protein